MVQGVRLLKFVRAKNVPIKHIQGVKKRSYEFAGIIKFEGNTSSMGTFGSQECLPAP